MEQHGLDYQQSSPPPGTQSTPSKQGRESCSETPRCAGWVCGPAAVVLGNKPSRIHTDGNSPGKRPWHHGSQVNGPCSSVASTLQWHPVDPGVPAAAQSRKSRHQKGTLKCISRCPGGGGDGGSCERKSCGGWHWFDNDSAAARPRTALTATTSCASPHREEVCASCARSRGRVEGEKPRQAIQRQDLERQPV